MGAKVKPSTKEYKRDARGKMTNQFTWKHYNVESISTKELLEYWLVFFSSINLVDVYPRI